MSKLRWKVYANGDLNAAFVTQSDADSYIAMMQEMYDDFTWTREEK